VTSVATDPRSAWLQRSRLLLLVWVTLTVALYFAARALPWESVYEQLKRMHPAWVLAAVLAYIAPLLVWAAEWRVLAPRLHRVGYWTMFEIVSVMAAVLNSIPFFAGEATGVALLVTRAGLPRGAALSVLAMDQLVGGMVKIVLLVVAATFVPLPGWLRAGVIALAAGVAVLFALLVPLAHRWTQAHDRLLAKATPGRQLVAAVLSWGEHLEAIRETHRVSKVALLALGRKSAELLGVLAVQMAFGLEPSMSAALLVLAALAIATMIPVSPGNLGVYEATVFAAYRFVGMPIDTAIGLALVQHACFLVPTLATGYLTATLRQLVPRVTTS